MSDGVKKSRVASPHVLKVKIARRRRLRIENSNKKRGMVEVNSSKMSHRGKREKVIPILVEQHAVKSLEKTRMLTSEQHQKARNPPTGPQNPSSASGDHS